MEHQQQLRNGNKQRGYGHRIENGDQRVFDNGFGSAERMRIGRCSMDKLRMAGAPATSVSTGSNGMIRNDVNMVDAGVKNEAKSMETNTGKRKRGRPPRVQGNNAPAQQLRQMEMEDEEDVCFVCFDGGELVLCDRRGCPKAYHPSCVKRDMSFFQSNTKWNCGWHICNSCQKASHYMCYTCPYSLCRRCTKNADYVCVRENKGFCGTCMRTIRLIENISTGNKEQIQVDFDDTTSWEYLFKVYWTLIKSKISLTIDELTKAKNPCEGDERGKAKISWAGAGTNSRGRKTQNRFVPLSKDLQGTMWATKELLEFVAYVRNGDLSILTYIDVEELLLQYIKRNNLLDPCRQGEIVCDQRLINLFGKARIGHFEMLRLLENHFLMKENSWAYSTISGISDAAGSQAELVSRDNDNQVVWDEKRRKPHNRSNERRPEINCNLDAHATIDAVGSQAQSCCSATVSTIATVSTGDQLSVRDTEAGKVWCYRDQNGKIQGPFSLMLLRKWNTIGLFHFDLRVWRVSEKEADSVLLADALCGKLYKAQKGPCLSLFPQEVTISSDYTNTKCDSGVSEDKKVDDNWKLMQNDASVHFSSNNEPLRSNHCTISASSTQPVDVSISRDEQAQSSLQVLELSKCTKSLADQEKICGSLPSSSSSLKLIEIPFLEVKDVHGNENRSACSSKSSECQRNFQQCDERQGSSSSRCNSDSGNVSKSEQNQGADMSNLPCSVPKHSQVDSKGHSIETRHSDSPNTIVPDSGPSWSTASSIAVEQTHLETAAKPLAEDWDSNVVSASLTKPNDGFHNLAATTAAGSGPMAHSSSLHPTIDTSSWQAIVPEQNEFCSLFGESVSDLLAQVEEMESLGSLPTPTSKLSCRKELMQGSDNNCFSQAEGFSPVLDHGKDDSLSFSINVAKPSRLNVSEERLQPSVIPASQPIVTAEPLELPQVSPQQPTANDQFQVSQVSSQPALMIESLGISKADTPDYQRRIIEHSSTSIAFDAKPSEALHNKRKRDSGIQHPISSAVSQGEACSNIETPSPSTVCSSKAASEIHHPASSTLAGNQGTVNLDKEVGQVDSNASLKTVHSVVQQHTSTSSTNRSQNSRGGHPRDRFSESRNHRNNFPRRDSSFGRDRSSRDRQPLSGAGNGGSSRAPPKGQRVCKFYERGCCKRGASCSYWHP